MKAIPPADIVKKIMELISKLGYRSLLLIVHTYRMGKSVDR